MPEETGNPSKKTTSGAIYFSGANIGPRRNAASSAFCAPRGPSRWAIPFTSLATLAKVAYVYAADMRSSSGIIHIKAHARIELHLIG